MNKLGASLVARPYGVTSGAQKTGGAPKHLARPLALYCHTEKASGTSASTMLSLVTSIRIWSRGWGERRVSGSGGEGVVIVAVSGSMVHGGNKRKCTPPSYLCNENGNGDETRPVPLHHGCHRLVVWNLVENSATKRHLVSQEEVDPKCRHRTFACCAKNTEHPALGPSTVKFAPPKALTKIHKNCVVLGGC